MRQDPHDGPTGRGGRGEGRRGPGASDPDTPPTGAVTGWFAGRLPDGASEAERRAATAGRITRFREDTRERRMRLADEA